MFQPLNIHNDVGPPWKRNLIIGSLQGLTRETAARSLSSTRARLAVTVSGLGPLSAPFSLAELCKWATPGR